MIIVRDLVKQYKNKYALRGVNLHIRPGEFVFLVGSAGAGKSTLMKMMYLEERPTRILKDPDDDNLRFIETENINADTCS